MYFNKWRKLRYSLLKILNSTLLFSRLIYFFYWPKYFFYSIYSREASQQFPSTMSKTCNRLRCVIFFTGTRCKEESTEPCYHQIWISQVSFPCSALNTDSSEIVTSLQWTKFWSKAKLMAAAKYHMKQPKNVTCVARNGFKFGRLSERVIL